MVRHASPAFVRGVQVECFMNCELLLWQIIAGKVASSEKTGESCKSSQHYYWRYKVDGHRLYGNCLRNNMADEISTNHLASCHITFEVTKHPDLFM